MIHTHENEHTFSYKAWQKHMHTRSCTHARAHTEDCVFAKRTD